MIVIWFLRVAKFVVYTVLKAGSISWFNFVRLKCHPKFEAYKFILLLSKETKYGFIKLIDDSHEV